jgi:hypothetical protein
VVVLVIAFCTRFPQIPQHYVFRVFLLIDLQLFTWMEGMARYASGKLLLRDIGGTRSNALQRKVRIVSQEGSS